jgi:hypothetical protein
MGDQPHKSLCSQANSLRSQPSNMASDAISPLSPTVSPGRVGGGGGLLEGSSRAHADIFRPYPKRKTIHFSLPEKVLLQIAE